MATNQEIAHRWAQFNGDNGKTPNGNLFYEGDTIYSYGYHFPIATLYNGLVIFNNDNYSVSTIEHQSCVSYAIGYSSIKLIVSTETIKHIVDKPAKINKKIVIRDRNNQISELVELHIKQKRARKRDYTEGIEEAIGNIRLLCSTFKISVQPLETILKDTEKAGKTLSEQQKRQKQAIARAEKKRKEQRLKEAQKSLKLWLAGEVNSGYGLHDLPPHLRVKKSDDPHDSLVLMVQTSHGASITYEEAKRLANIYIAITSTMDGDYDFNKLDKKPKFGHYTIDKILATGDMIAGCHHFKAETLNDFINQQGWRA